MNKYLHSLDDVKRALGKNAHTALRDVGGRRKNKSAQDRLRRSLLDRFPYSCATCGAAGSEKKKLEAAHITSVQEGGSFEVSNAALLCRRCHRLFDKECLWSRAEVRRAATAWRQNKHKGKLLIRLQKERTPAAAEDYKHLVNGGRYGKAVRILKQQIKDAFTEDRRIERTIRLGETYRRSTGSGSLRLARSTFDSLTPSGIPLPLRSGYFYEYGYLCQCLGEFAKSIECFRQSEKWARKNGNRKFELIAKHRQFAVSLISTNPRSLSRKETNKRAREFAKLAAEFTAMKDGGWVHNALGWAWRSRIKGGQIDHARDVLDQRHELRDTQHRKTGFTETTSTNLCGQRGMTLLLDPGTKAGSDEFHNGVTLLCRSIITLLKGGRVRQEGIRDFFLVLERAISMCAPSFFPDARATARAIHRVRPRILDGSSFLDPSRSQ